MLARLLLAAALAAGLSRCDPASAQTATALATGCGQASPSAGPGAALTVGPSGVLCADIAVQSAAVFRGVVIAATGASQPLMAANPKRRGWNLQNQSGGTCWWKIGAAATQDYQSFRLADGAYWETPPGHTSTGAVNVVCAANTGGLYATEW